MIRTLAAVALAAALAAAQEPALKEASAANTEQGAPHGIGILDANTDGRPDVVIAQTRPSGVNVFLNDGKGNVKGNFNAMLGTRMGPNFGQAANVDGDAFMDFYQLDNNSGFLAVYKGGKGRLSDLQETDFKTTWWPISAYTCDFNGDRRPDFVVAGWPDNTVDKGGGRLKVVLGPTFKESWSVDMAECGAALGGDVTGDKRPDVVTTDQKESALVVYAGDGRGNFNKQPLRIPLDESDKALKPNGIALADLDGDKNLDVAVCCEDRQFVRLMKSDGKGGFAKLADLALPTKAKFAVTGDFNGDKNLDIATGACVVQAGALWNIAIWLGDGKGGYTKNCEFSGKGNFHFYNAAAGDMDLDKKDDLAVSVINEDEVSGTVRRYLSKK